MSFDNNYPNRKDRRKQYYRSGVFDRSCRPGGDCPYCKRNRLFNRIKKDKFAQQEINEYQTYDRKTINEV